MSVVGPSDVMGSWDCRPYTLKHELFSSRVTQRQAYDPNGTFTSTSSQAITVFGTGTFYVVDRITGTWRFDGYGRLVATSKTYDLISSTDRSISLARQEAEAQERLRKRPVLHYRMEIDGRSLRSVLLDDDSPVRGTVVVCDRAE